MGRLLTSTGHSATFSNDLEAYYFGIWGTPGSRPPCDGDRPVSLPPEIPHRFKFRRNNPDRSGLIFECATCGLVAGVDGPRLPNDATSAEIRELETAANNTPTLRCLPRFTM